MEYTKAECLEFVSPKYIQTSKYLIKQYGNHPSRIGPNLDATNLYQRRDLRRVQPT